ncbi:MAG: hypothetical protein J6573_07495 [Lactobacillus sp.]|nr:hypothetical protein [Lactobacillus sp.]
MLKIDLYDPKIGDTKHYEQSRVAFGDFKRVLAFDKLTAQNEAKRKILNQKLEAGTLTDKEAKEYVRLSSTSEEELDAMEDIIVSLFHNPKVTKKALEEGLDSNGIEVLKQILTDAMGGIEADNNHPAKN